MFGLLKLSQTEQGYHQNGSEPSLKATFPAPTKSVCRAPAIRKIESETGARVREISCALNSLLSASAVGPAPFFQSQGLKVGGSTARWVFVVTVILDSSHMCVWSRLHTTQPRRGASFHSWKAVVVMDSTGKLVMESILETKAEYARLQ